MTVVVVAVISLCLGIWWGLRWADWSRRVDSLLQDEQR